MRLPWAVLPAGQAVDYKRSAQEDDTMMAVTIINPSIIPLLVGGIIFADVVAVICLILICLTRRDLRQRAQTVEVPAAAAPPRPRAFF